MLWYKNSEGLRQNFYMDPSDKCVAICIHCGEERNCKGRNIYELSKHLRAKHEIDINPLKRTIKNYTEHEQEDTQASGV